MKQTKNGSYEKINAIWRKKVKTNKNGNNCSTKDLVVKAADIFKAKPAKQKEHKLCFYKRIRGRQQLIHPLRVCTVAKNDHQGTFH